MKKLSTFIFCLLSLGTLVAQIRLDVEGDAKIRGRLDIKLADDDSSLFIGEHAGMIDEGGNNNTFVGTNAGQSNTKGHFNAFFGKDAGINNTEGYSNAFFGKDAGINNTEGYSNAFFGKDAGFNNISGERNAFLGMGSGFNTIDGDDNAFFGMNAGFSNVDGNFNAFFGRAAGFGNTSGQENAFFGRAAGYSYNNTRSTLLGHDAGTLDSLDRAISIGYQAKVACHNCAVIGGTGDNAVKVGIGTSTPLNPMHIVQSDAENDFQRGIRLALSDKSKYWTTFGDVNGRYNITYNGNYLAFIDTNGNYNNPNSSFVSENGSSRSRSSNIQSMDRVLDKVKKLQPATKKLSNSRNARKIWGFVTEEVAELFPEIAPETDGRKSIIYDYFGILSIKAVQELAADLEIQTKEKEDLKEVVEQQQTQIDELKSLVEKFLTQNAETPKSTSYVLPLEQQALLAQNQPNPFRENTLVDYFVPVEVQNAHIQVTGLDGQVLGQVAITEKGKGQVTIQSRSYPAGTYFYSLVLDGQVMETKRMVLAR